MERVFIDQERLSIPTTHLSRRQSSSQLSDLAEYVYTCLTFGVLTDPTRRNRRCPVCNRNLDQVGSAAEQEAHVKNCLEGGGPGSGATQQAAKYLVYRLPAESTLIGIECEFTCGLVK